jgi:hypothetical protein
MDDCPHCEGTGERDWLSGARCYECKGTGIEKDDDPCPDCQSDGGCSGRCLETSHNH